MRFSIIRTENNPTDPSKDAITVQITMLRNEWQKLKHQLDGTPQTYPAFPLIYELAAMEKAVKVPEAAE